MRNLGKITLFIVLMCICFFQSGCAVLNIPFQAAGAVAQLASKALDLAKELPMPLPGVF